MADGIEEIKSRLGIYELVSQYVQLKKAGVNYKGLCPFHGEKTASFVVSPEKQIFHCFGCHKGGDIFTFVQEIEGVDFPEAIQVLADKAGVKIENFEKHAKKGANKSEKDEYFKAHELACSLFEEQLYKSNDGEKVLQYLYKRGLKDETIKNFRIGFSPDKYDFLYPYLLKKGISKSVLLKSGFISTKSIADENVYDKFRGRLMFPIFDYMGRICGFGGRALSKDQMPKYLNSPENIIYSKGKILYGLSHAKSAVKQNDRVVLVEGYFDVILPFQEGVENIVATSGTALTSEQVRLIKRFTSKVVSCFDTDNAGFEATRRAFELLHKAEMEMKTVSAFYQKDPADFVLEEGGAKFESVLNGANDFIQFFIDKLLAEFDGNSLDGRRKVFGALSSFYLEFSPIEKDFFIRYLAMKLKVDNKLIFDQMANFVGKRVNYKEKNFSDSSNLNPKVSLQQIIFSLVLKYPVLFEHFFEKIDENLLDDEFKSIYKVLTDQYNSSRNEFVTWDFNEKNLADLKEKADILLLYAEDKYEGFSEKLAQEELERLLDKYRRDRRSEKLKKIRLEIELAEKSQEKGKLLELLKIQQDLLST